MDMARKFYYFSRHGHAALKNNQQTILCYCLSISPDSVLLLFRDRISERP
jgi:hypothetical protein